MPVSTFVPRPARLGRCLNVALAAMVLAIALPAPASYAVGSGTRFLRSRAPTLASVLRPLTSGDRRYVVGIMSLTPLQLWGAFGTSPAPPPTISRTMALPILPACAPGPCWRATTSRRRPSSQAP